MQLAPAGVSLSFEVTFDSPDLPVAMSVYDDSGPTPVLVQGPTGMLNFVDNTYRGKFTGIAGKSYVVLKAVYLDDSFTTLDPTRSQGSESFIAQDIAGGTTTAIIYQEIEAEIVPYGSQSLDAVIEEEEVLDAGIDAEVPLEAIIEQEDVVDGFIAAEDPIQAVIDEE